MNPSRAEQFFQQIVASPSPADFIKGLVKTSTFETEWLDFKGADQLTGPSPSKAPDKIEAIWSEALSGFANTQGGVLLWGINASKDPVTKVDAANQISYVHGPDKLASRLLELHGGATDPPVLGVEVRAYDDPNSPGDGFVVCYVPESSNRPHRAESRGKRYFIRALDDFRDAPVSLLRLLFFPQSKPVLVPHIQTNVESGSINLNLVLSNCGSASAGDMVLRIDYDLTYPITPATRSKWFSAPHPGPPPYRYWTEQILHPGDSILAGAFITRQENIRPPAGMSFSVDCLCRDGEPWRWRIDLLCTEMLNPYKKIGTREKLLAFMMPDFPNKLLNR